MKYYKSEDNLSYGRSEEIPEGMIEITEQEYKAKIDEIVIVPKKNRTLRPKERIAQLKKFLSETDYLAIKFSEGELAEEEYGPIRLQRREWRNEINQLEEDLK